MENGTATIGGLVPHVQIAIALKYHQCIALALRTPVIQLEVKR